MRGDLTRGPITRTILLFALPMMLGNLLQQCYNVADTLIVGRFLGSAALAAVGSAYTLMTFLTSILLGLSLIHIFRPSSHPGDRSRGLSPGPDLGLHRRRTGFRYPCLLYTSGAAGGASGQQAEGKGAGESKRKEFVHVRRSPF